MNLQDLQWHVHVNTCADLLDDGLRPLKAALLVLLRHAGATKLAKALEPGVMDGGAKGVGGKDTPRPIGPAGVGMPMPPTGVAASSASTEAAEPLFRGVDAGSEVDEASARGTVLALLGQLMSSTGPA